MAREGCQPTNLRAPGDAKDVVSAKKHVRHNPLKKPTTQTPTLGFALN